MCFFLFFILGYIIYQPSICFLLHSKFRLERRNKISSPVLHTIYISPRFLFRYIYHLLQSKSRLQVLNEETQPFAMMMRLCLLLLLLSPFVVADQRRRPVDGGWGPIENLDTPETKTIAEFAVSEINKESNNKKLVFQRVLKGESQVVQGLMYLLDIEVKDESSPHPSTTVVYQCSVFDGILDEGMQLRKSCEILSCS